MTFVNGVRRVRRSPEPLGAVVGVSLIALAILGLFLVRDIFLAGAQCGAGVVPRVGDLASMVPYLLCQHSVARAHARLWWETVSVRGESAILDPREASG